MAKTLDEAGVKRLIQEIKGANKNLNTPIPISRENTTESMAQNVKNIADYVEKAKAAGIESVNGMAVTCLIDDENSGVGYLYVTNTQVLICGILAYEDNSVSCISVLDGTYREQSIVIEGHIGQVTSDMLAQGARRPIILTPDTTEVDEETYQKLLSDDVDVVFKDAYNALYYVYDVNKNVSVHDIEIRFVNTLGSIDTIDPSDYYFSVVSVEISKNAPHTVITETGEHTLLDVLNDSGYLNNSILSPVLQEIDLTGTDADRKAKLDQFEADWMRLTGASDLNGARFVGNVSMNNDEVTTKVLLSRDQDDNYSGISMSDDSDVPQLKKIVVLPYNGFVISTSLFSHLEAITIRTGNTPGDKAANVAAIKAYVDNLKDLGVDVTKGYMIPICFSDTELGYVMYHPFSTGSEYTGIVTGPGGASSNIAIEKNGYAYVTTHIQPVESSSLTTTAKSIVPAINEVNALAKGYSTIFTPIELTTETAQNKTAIDARVAAFTAQGISPTNGCCIPVTYKGVYAGNISLINGDWYGLLVKNTNNPADNINIKLSADGTITEGNSAQ